MIERMRVLARTVPRDAAFACTALVVGTTTNAADRRHHERHPGLGMDGRAASRNW